MTLPISGLTAGDPEWTLEMRRFYSDKCGKYMIMMNKVVKDFVPAIPTSSNHWSENPEIGLDYRKYYREFMKFPGIGFYHGLNPEDRMGVVGACMINDHRMGEEFGRLKKLGIFPRKTSLGIGLAYSFESRLVTEYAQSYYKTSFLAQHKEVYFSI